MNIQSADECKLKFDELKFRKIDGRYLVFQILNEKIVICIIKLDTRKSRSQKLKLGVIRQLTSRKRI